MCGKNFLRQFIISIIIFNIFISMISINSFETFRKDFTAENLKISDIEAWDVIVYNDYLYVAAEFSVEIFNLKSDKFNPPHVKSIPRVNELTDIRDIYVNQDILSVSMSGNVHLYNITDPYSAFELCQIPHLGGNVYDFYIEGNLLFVCNTVIGFKIYDIGNPSAPTLLSSTSIGDSVTEVHVLGNLAFILSDYSITDNRSFAVLNFTNPSFPELIYESNYSYSSSLLNIYSNGEIIYLFGDDGFFIYSFNGVTTELLKHFNTISVRDYAIKDDLMYTTGTGYSILKFDISNFSNPFLITNYIGGYTWALDLYEDNIYTAVGNDGVLVININNIYPPTTTSPIPTTPTNTSSVYTINVSLSSLTIVASFTIVIMIILVAYRKNMNKRN